MELKIGSLYGVLDRLATEGLIEADREEAHEGRPRRDYRLTRMGGARWLRRPRFTPLPRVWCRRGWA